MLVMPLYEIWSQQLEKLQTEGTLDTYNMEPTRMERLG